METFFPDSFTTTEHKIHFRSSVWGRVTADSEIFTKKRFNSIGTLVHQGRCKEMT